MDNPYTLTFGIEPSEYISREKDKVQVLNDFRVEHSPQQVYLVTGVRGSGKTVFMTDLINTISNDSSWIVVDLNPNMPDLLKEAAAYLCSIDTFANIFRRAKLNFSLLGFGIEVSNSVPIVTYQTALERMIISLGKKKYRILFTIDEVTSSPQVRIFTSAFQQFLRKKLPVYMLMTGLYDNVSDLQNYETLTFLHRAPKIVLPPLNADAIAENYKKNLKLSDDEAHEMADLTKGYSYAFQILGYLVWNSHGNYKDLIRDYKTELFTKSYEKIWSELSPKDQEVVSAIVQVGNGRISEIRDLMKMKPNEFSPYRARLINKGVIESPQRGMLTFSLPFFEDFVKDIYEW